MEFVMKKLLLALALTAGSAQAAWQLDAAQSSLRFVTVKNDVVAETHRFNQLQGQWADDGQFNVQIPVKGLDTLIPIRNERMQEHLFQASKFATITASGRLDSAKISALSSGTVATEAVELTLTLLDQTQKINVELSLVKLSDNRVLAYTKAPVLIKATDFKLEAGVKKLQELAKLNRIELVVPVSFDVQFSR
jgi:polyisoprenoid-binding protein YceI